MASSSSGRVISSGSDLAEDDMGGLMSGEEGEQVDHSEEPHAVESDPNYATIPIEALEAVGIDIENMAELSEEQMGVLLALAETSAAPVAAAHQRPLVRNSLKREAAPVVQNDTADNLTMVISEDGSLKLTDSAQQDFYFSAEQLAAHNIDVNNLTDESIQQIVQVAMPSLDMGKSVENKRRKLEGSLPSTETAQIAYENMIPTTSMMGASSNAAPSTSAPPKISFPVDHRSDHQFALIGEVIDVKRNGKMVPATIRYCRSSGGYKVQFSDGHFEWVTEEQIRVRGGSKARSDHESYSGMTDMDTGRVGVSSTGIGRRAPPAIPGIKVTPSNTYNKEGEPNFCCVICDRKVYQKEPQYIVIRVPACDACTELKIMVLDTSTEERGVQSSPTLEHGDTIYEDEPNCSEKLVDGPPSLERSIDDSAEEHVVSSSEQIDNCIVNQRDSLNESLP